jgi:LysM repeat protein
VCWVAAILAVAMIGFGFARGLQPSAPQVVGSQAVVVESGDTLWQLARQVNPRVDPRATISAIRQVNGLGSSSVVQEGTTLAVPVYR